MSYNLLSNAVPSCFRLTLSMSGGDLIYCTLTSQSDKNKNKNFKGTSKVKNIRN